MKCISQLNNRGQGLVEYLIIVCLMAVGTMAIMRVMNRTVQGQFARIAVTLQGGDKKSVRLETITEDDYKKRDMSNFFHGARSHKDDKE